MTKGKMSDDEKWHWGEGNKFVIEGGKTILLVNGAASVGMLTFIGNNLKLHPTALVISMMLFAGGAMSTALIFAGAYVTQLYYGNANHSAAKKWHFVTYGAVAFSLLLFVVGVGCAACGFLRLS